MTTVHDNPAFGGSLDDSKAEAQPLHFGHDPGIDFVQPRAYVC